MDTLKGLVSGVKGLLKTENWADSLVKNSIVDSNGVEKSALDQRNYKAFELDNGLTVLLVNDHQAVKSAAALSVQVGSWSNPDEVPGLFHFLEHMLFMGTEKYPVEEEYQKFLAERGGSSNAYTAEEETNYQFEVTSEHLEPALDRFAQFFIAPLLNPGAVDRELKAVDNEFSDGKMREARRTQSVLKAICHKNNSFHKFAVGNIETLKTTPAEKKIDVVKMLRENYEKFYSANRMKLVVLGRDSLETLEAWVRTYFSDIENKNLPNPYIPGSTPPAFDERNLGQEVSIVPVKDSEQSLSLRWIFDPATPENKLDKYFDVLGNVIGDETEGSIISYLRKKNLATALSAGAFYFSHSFSMFGVSILCTEEGILEKRHEILGAVYAYIELVSKQLTSVPWMFDELTALAAINFKFKGEGDAFDYVTGLASSMQFGHPISETLTAGIKPYPTGSMKTVLDLVARLTPENMLVTVLHKSVEEVADQTEKWYETSYVVNPFSAELKNLLKNTVASDFPSLKLPEQNTFVPKNLEILSFVAPTLAAPPVDAPKLLKAALAKIKLPVILDLEHGAIKDKREIVGNVQERDVREAWPDKYDIWRPPVLVKSTDSTALWLKQDTAFKRPRAVISFLLGTNVANLSPRNSVMSGLYASMMAESLTEKTYQASLAGLEYSLSYGDKGVYIRFFGYNDSMAEFQKFVVAAIKDTSLLRPDQFERLKNLRLINWKNWNKGDPFRLCLSKASAALTSFGWTTQELIESLEDLKHADVVNFVPTLYEGLNMEMFVFGNVTPADADRSFRLANDAFKPTLSFSQLKQKRTAKLAPGSEVYFLMPAFHKENKSSALISQLQCGSYDVTIHALIRVLGAMLYDAFFTELRTKQQLGYIVATASSLDHGVHSLKFVIQSNAKDPIYMDNCIEKFLVEYRDEVKDLTEEAFNNTVNGEIVKLLETKKTLYGEFGTWEDKIQSQSYEFTSRHKLAKALAEITRAELLDFYDSYIAPTGKQRAKFTAGCIADDHAKALFGDSYKNPFDGTGEISGFSEEQLRPHIKVNAGRKVSFAVDVKDFRKISDYHPTRNEVLEKLV